MRSDERGSLGALLLLLLALFVLFILVRRCLSVIVSEVYLFSELDAEVALLDPGRFRLQGYRLARELLQHGVVHAWDHVGRLYKGEGKARLQVQTGARH